MKSSAMSIELSAEPSRLGALTSEQRDRLTAVLDRYLSSLETDTPIARETLLDEHADLADTLRIYLDGLDDLQGLASRFHSAEPMSDGGAEEARARRIGDFEIVREIGRGGMGVVYEAHQISLARRVALKILPFAAMLDARQVARFKNEAQAAAQLYHPNIVPVHAVGVERGVHFYAMKFIEGQPLDHAIRELARARGYRDGTTESLAGEGSDGIGADTTISYPGHASSGESVLSVERSRYLPTVIRIGIQAAEALHAAHEFGIVHRDIKPSNLLLDADVHLWVTDYGLARCQSDVTLTRSGDLIGTLRYMSPEQATGQTALVDLRSDIYSLGATLYELLTLRPAFGGDDAQNLIRRISQEEPKSLRQLCPDVPLDLQTVIAKAMSKQSADRYATASAFADDLRRVLEGKPTVARPPTLVDRAVKWTRRHTRLVLATTAGSVVAAAVLVAGMLYVLGAKQASDKSSAEAGRHFRAAHESVNALGSRTAQALKAIPGAENARKRLLVETLAYYQKFVLEARNSPALLADLALTYSKIGILIDEIGSAEKAIAAHRQAVDAFERLTLEQPDEAEHRRQLGLAHNNLATALARAGNTEEARAEYAAAIDLLKRLVASSSAAGTTEARRYRLDLAVTHANVGLFYRDTNEKAAAQREFGEAVRLQEGLLGISSQDDEVAQILAGTYNNLGSLYLDGEPQRAKGLFASALDLRERMAEHATDDWRFQGDLALSYHNLAAVTAKLGEFETAAEAYADAIKIQERLVQLAPDQKDRQRELAKTITSLGLAQDRLKNPKEAEASFRRALRVWHAVAGPGPKDPETASGLGGTFNNLGIVLQEMERPREAASAYQQAIKHQRDAHSAAPGVQRYREFLLKHLFNYARVERESGEIDRALGATAERRELLAKDPQRLLSVAEEFAVAYERLAAAEKRRGDVGRPPDSNAAAASASVTTAAECARLAIDTLRQAVAEGLPATVDFRRSPAFAALGKTAEFREAFGE